MTSNKPHSSALSWIWNGRQPRSARWRIAGKRMLPLALIGGLLLGCATGPTPLPASMYRVQIPELQVKPKIGLCGTTEGVAPIPCIILGLADWEAIIRELKAACLALPGPNESEADLKARCLAQ